MWDIESGEELRKLDGHTNRVNAVAVTPDGKKAISASYDRTLKVWDVESGEELRTMEGHTDFVFGVAVTPDGKKAISASADNTLRVWNVESGGELRTLRGHTDAVRTVVVTPDGKKAISASYDRTLKVWDVESGEDLRTMEGHIDVVEAVAVTPDGKKAISASYDRTLKVWDVESGEDLRTMEGHFGSVYGVSVTPDGKKAISASADNTLKVWDVESGEELRKLEGHTDRVRTVVITPDGKKAISTSNDDTLKVWDIESGEDLRTMEGHTDAVRAVVITPDGTKAISASYDDTLKVWDIESGEELRTLRGHTDTVYGVAVTPDGKKAISTSYDDTLKVWDIEESVVTKDFLTYENPTHGIKINYPGDWDVIEDLPAPLVVGFISPLENSLDDIFDNVLISVGDLLSPMSLDDVTDLFIARNEKNVDNFKIIESNATTLGGVPAHKIVFTGKPKDSPVDLEMMQVLTVIEKRFYMIQFFAEQGKYSDYLPTIQLMIDSFEIATIPDVIETKEFLLYEDATRGIKIKYPVEWEKVELDQPEASVAFVSPDENDLDVLQENLIFGFDKLQQIMTLDEYIKRELDIMSARKGDFTLIESQPTSLAGNPAHKIVWTSAEEIGYTIKTMQLVMIKENKAYIITFAGDSKKYDSYLPIVQQMIDSFEIFEIKRPEIISGHYIDLDVGLEIDFPEGWIDTNIPSGNITMVMAMPPLVFAKLGSGEKVTDVVFMGVTIRDLSESVFSQSTGSECEKLTSVKITTLNDMKILEFDPTRCEFQGMMTNMKMYVLLTEENSVEIFYAATDNDYETNIAKFEESFKTLKIENTIDISDPSAIAAFTNETLTKQTVMVEGNPYDIDILSNSIITDFTFSEESKAVSFKVEGKEGTEDGPTVYVDKVLEGPYTVTIDGKPMEEWMVIEDKTTDQTSLGLSYAEGVHDITVIGTQVVPEYPIFALVIFAAAVSLIFATRLMPKLSKGIMN